MQQGVFCEIMKERYHVEDDEPQRLKIFAYTNGSALTAEQPLNNIIRVTIETMAAIAGGIQTLATSSYDEAFSLPTQEAVTVSLRTQQIVGYESGITNTVDALGGSYAIESLTNRIESDIYGISGQNRENGWSPSNVLKQVISRESWPGWLMLTRRAVITEKESSLVLINLKIAVKLRFQLLSCRMKQLSDRRKKLDRIKKMRDGSRVQRALEC